MEVKCPHCGTPTVFSPANPFRPFCSERCRLIDLGAWADGSYAVPSEEKTSIQDPLLDISNEDKDYES